MNCYSFSSETRECLRRLNALLIGMGEVAVAFSGGIDSALLLDVASRIDKLKILAVTVRTQLFPLYEMGHIFNHALRENIEHLLINADIFSRQEIVENSPQRCYHCKKFIFSIIKNTASERGITTVVDGTHSEDYGDYRPGIKALSELGVKSPLQEAGFAKRDIRELAKHYCIDGWDLPPASCLATRIPYGVELNYRTIRVIEKGESYLRDMGFPGSRLRVHGSIARIEVPSDRISELVSMPVKSKVSGYFKTLGFDYITIDIEGYRSGSMNLDTGEK